MQGETAAVRSRHVDHGVLDPATFELHVHRGPVADCLENVSKSRDSVAFAEIDLRELTPRGLCDHSSLNGFVVMDHDLAVSCRMDVELDRVRAMVDGELETRQRVLRAFPRRSPMRNALKPWSTGGSGTWHTGCIIPQPSGRQALNK